MASAWPLLILLQLTGSKMQDNPIPPAGSPFGLSGEQYWSEPFGQPQVSAFGNDLLFKMGEGRGLHIDVPAKVYRDKHKSIPLVAFQSDETRIIHNYPLRKSAHMVLAHLETGKINMAKAAETPMKDPNAPDGEPGPGWVVDQVLADAADAGLGPGLGRYAVFMISGPDASNTRAFSVFPSAAAETASETKVALKGLRHEGGPVQPLASTKRLRLRHEPMPPLKDGVMPFQLAPDTTGQSPHRVHLGFRLAGLPRFVYPKDKPVQDDEGKRVFANLPVFLVAFDGDRTPVLIELIGLPIAAGPGLDPEAPTLAGHLSFDLETLIKPQKPGTKLTLWAICMDRKTKLELVW